MRKVSAMKIALAILLAAGTAACATPPSRIKAVANAGPCTAADRANLALLSNQQRDAVAGDTIGVILVGVPVASLTGGRGREAKIAILKGRCG